LIISITNLKKKYRDRGYAPCMRTPLARIVQHDFEIEEGGAEKGSSEF